MTSEYSLLRRRERSAPRPPIFSSRLRHKQVADPPRKHLDLLLFRRSQRGRALTEAGKEYLLFCKKALRLLREGRELLVWTDTWLKRSGRWQIVAAQDAAFPPMSQDDSKVIFVSAKQLNTQIHEAPEVGAGVSRIDLSEYTSSKGGATVMRRTKPFRAEVHKRLADIWYVTAGGGTLVTGGSLVEPVQTDSDELRGRGVTGGQEQHIAQGDFVRIPAGVPHWIRSIDGDEILYLVVKTASPR